MKILVVEDSVDIALLLQLLLRSDGHEVEIWTSDFAALEGMGLWADIDAILCDQQLDDYDGKDLFEWLSHAHPHIRRVMITGSSITDENEAHADKVLIKPVSAEAVRVSIR